MVAQLNGLRGTLRDLLALGALKEERRNARVFRCWPSPKSRSFSGESTEAVYPMIRAAVRPGWAPRIIVPRHSRPVRSRDTASRPERGSRPSAGAQGTTLEGILERVT